MPPHTNIVYLYGTTPIGIGAQLREQAKAAKPPNTYNHSANFAAPRRYVSEKEESRMFQEKEKMEKKALKALKREEERKALKRMDGMKGGGCEVM
jgi:hypothetical protein